MNGQIVDYLKSIICNLANLKSDEVSIEANLFDDLGIDSVSALQVLAAVEDKYGVRFEDWDLADFNTIEKIMLRIKEKILK